MPWEHEAHRIFLHVDARNEKDTIRVRRDGKTVDIKEMEEEGFELMSVVHDDGHDTLIGVFKRFVKE
jgi:hypothetical protein